MALSLVTALVSIFILVAVNSLETAFEAAIAANVTGDAPPIMLTTMEDRVPAMVRLFRKRRDDDGI